MKPITARVAALSAASAIVLSVSSQAQDYSTAFDRDPVLTADKRPNPETDPVPLPVGIFVV